MKYYFYSTKNIIIIVAMILLGGLNSTIYCQFFYKLENPIFSLKARIEISLNQIIKDANNKRVWIAYMIKNNAAIPFVTMKNTNLQNLPRLKDLIQYGNNDSSVHRNQISRSGKVMTGLNDFTDTEFAVLMDYNVGYGKPILSQIVLTSLNKSFDLQGRDVHWLGEISTEESINWLQDLFDISQYLKIKRQIIATLGYHIPHSLIDNFFNHIIWGDYDEQLQEDCIFLFGKINSQKSEKYLSQIVLKKKNTNLQKKALLALSQSNSDYALKIISSLACKCQNDVLRKEAIFCLGQMENRKVLPLLQRIILSEKDSKLKKFTVFVISQVSNKKTRFVLHQISRKHPDADVRKKALYWLGKISNHKGPSNFQKNTGDF